MSTKKKGFEDIACERCVHLKRSYLVSLLEKNKWNRMKCAKEMRVSRATFFRYLQAAGLTRLRANEWRKL